MLLLSIAGSYSFNLLWLTGVCGVARVVAAAAAAAAAAAHVTNAC
jgi:hypothetical protein